MRKITFLRTSIMSMFILFMFSVSSWGQATVSLGNTYTQNFNSIGTTAAATLPTGWVMEKNTTVRSVTIAYTSGLVATENVLAYNVAMSSTASNGLWNFGSGSSAGDQAIGGISSSSGSKTVNMFLKLTNNGASTIPGFTINYDVKRFRNGSNAAGYSIRFYYSTTGAASSWTEVPANVLSFTANADNNGSTTNPMEVKSISNYIFNQSVDANASIYFAWSYSVTTGTTTSSAQALGIDNVSIKAATPAITSPTPTSLTGFSTITGTASDAQTFTVDGANLVGDLTVTAPADFEVRESGVGSYAASVAFTPTTGTVSSKTIDVRVKAEAAANAALTGTLTITSSGATQKEVALSGVVNLPTALASVKADGSAYATSGAIVVKGGAAFEVYNSVGQSVAKVNAGSDVNTLSLRPGIYVVKSANKTTKVVVR